MMRILRGIFKRFGYFFLKEGYMPKGIYLESDLKRLINLNRIASVVDVGAFQGSMTEYFLEIFPNSDVIAIEPSPASFEFLKRFENDLRVELMNFGVSEKNSKLEFQLFRDSQLNSFKNIKNDEADPIETITIETQTISNILLFSKKRFESIDFLKIDVEGFETECLKGCKELLEENRIGMIYVECGFCADDNRHTPFRDIHQTLSEYGFSLYGFYDLYHYRKPTELLFANALFLNDSYLDRKLLLSAR